MKRIQESNWLLIVGYANGHEEYISCVSREEASRRRGEIAARQSNSAVDPAVMVITPVNRTAAQGQQSAHIRQISA